MYRTALRLAPFAGLLIILAACSAGAQPSPGEHGPASPSPDMPMASDNHAAGFAWGEPAHAGDADRVVEISMTDELRFEPDAVEVSVGEMVTFRVTNAGQLTHDFTGPAWSARSPSPGPDQGPAAPGRRWGRGWAP